MHHDPDQLRDRRIEQVDELEECDGYVVLVRDAQTGETDAHGPFDGPGAGEAANRLRLQFHTDQIDDIDITIARLHFPGRP